MNSSRSLLKVLLGVVGLAGFGLVVWGGTENANQPAPPPPPPWVRADGTVDESKLPAAFGVVGSDGRPLLDEHGQEVTISREELFGPPPAKPALVPPASLSDES